MKRVTAQPVNTYVRPDSSKLSLLQQRQRQVAGAFEQLGVNVKQARQHELEDMKAESDQLRTTQSNDAAGKIKLALDWARLDENKQASREQLEADTRFQDAHKALDSITDTRVREHMKARLEESKAMVLQRHSATLRQEKKDHDERLQASAVNAKIKLAVDEMSLEENRYKTSDDFANIESVTNAMEAIKEVSDPFLRETLEARFAQARTGVMTTHANTLRREDNLNHFSAVTADVLMGDFDAGDIDKLISDHKETLGDDTVPALARIAIASDSLLAVDALIARATEGKQEDIPPVTLSQLVAAKGRIEADIERAAKADKTRYYYDLNVAKDVQDRGEKLQAFQSVLEDHEGVMTDEARGSLMADMQTLREEVQTENAIKHLLGTYTTEELAHNLPPRFRKLTLGDVKDIQNSEWRKALNDGRISDALYMMRDPTDIPSAATEHFGSLLSSAGTENPDEPSQDFINKLNMATEIEAKLGATHMRNIMRDEPYAEFQMFAGFAAQEGIQTALSRFQEYKLNVDNGRNQLPEGFSTIKRDVVDEVASELDAPSAEINETLTPYFKVWGQAGLDESQMVTQAKRILGNTTWNGIVNGRGIQDAFNAMITGVNGKKYDETPEEMFEMAMEKTVENFKKLQPHIEGDVQVSVVPTNPNYLHFTSEEGIPLVQAIQPISVLVNRAKESAVTIKDKALREAARIKQVRQNDERRKRTRLRYKQDGQS